MRHRGNIALVFVATFLAAAPSLADSRWVPLGPFGGSIETLTVDPTNARTLYVTLGIPGTFKSSDGGKSWTNIHNGTSRSLAVDPSQPQTLYLASKTWLFKSKDGGRRWTAVESLGYDAVLAVAVDPVTPSCIYAGTSGHGVLRSVDRGATWGPAQIPLPADASTVRAVVPALPQGSVFALTDGGLFKSTDSGLSWFASGQGLPAGAPLALTVDPADPQKVYVSLLEGVFHSTDGGGSWMRTASQPVESGAVLSLVISAQGIWAGAEPSGLFRSTDGGAHWSVAGPQRRVTAVAVAPTSPRTIYLGTTAQGSFLGGVFVSTNGGVSWAQRNQWLTGVAVQSLEVIPAIPGWMWIGASTQGLLQSRDGGQTWTRASLKLPDFDLESSPVDPLLLYAYSWPRLWQTLDGGVSWSEILSPSNSPRPTAGDLWADLADPMKLWGRRGCGLVMSRDAGVTWAVVKTIAGCCSMGDLAFAPSSPSTLYMSGTENLLQPACRYSGSVVLRSTDGGVTWTNTGLSARAAAVGPLAVDPLNPQLVYAAIAGNSYTLYPGGLFRSENSGTGWSEIDHPIGGPWRISVLAAPRAGVVWAVQDHYLGQRIFRSTDAGDTWQERRKNLRAQTVYKLVGDPASPRKIYAATSNGVWVLTEAD